MTRFRQAIATLAACAAAWAAAATAAEPAGIETFEGMPFGTTRWTSTPTSWTNAETGNAWVACNARASWVHGEGNPALSIQSASASEKGFWRSQGTLGGGVQKVRAAFRQVLSSRADCEVQVNGVVVGRYVSGGGTGQVDVLEWETVDPATGLPFDGPFELAISNRVGASGTVAFDDVEWTPFRLFVQLDKTGTNVAYAADGEFDQPEFDVTATVHLPGGTVQEAVDGRWTVEPAFAGTMNAEDDPHLTLSPSMADVGKEFTLTFTAWAPAEEVPEGEGAPVGGEAGEVGGEGEEAPAPEGRFAHSASVKIRVEAATSPRYVDFEDMGACTYSAVPRPIVLAGASWMAAGVSASDKTDRKIGAKSLRIRHLSTNAATFESPFYPGGLGTLSFRYANYHTNHPMALQVQTRGEEDDEDAWRDVADGAVSFVDRLDIEDVEFRVDIHEGGARAFRIVSTAANGSIADIDDVRIRAAGETAPVLVWRGEPAAGLGQPWTGTFTYLHPTNGYEFSWRATPELPRLAAATNLEDGTLTFTLEALPEDWGDYVIEATVHVAPDGTPDQRASAALSVAAFPEFELAPVATTVSNIVDIFVTNVVLYGAGTNWTVAWTAEPPFKGTNTLHNKSRYRVLDIVDDDGPHLVTAVLTDSKTKLSATRQVTIEVRGSSGGDDPEPFWIAEFSATNLCVVHTTAGWRYAAFAVEDLAAGPGATNRVWTGTAATGGAEGLLWLEIEPPGADGRRFYGVEILPAE